MKRRCMALLFAAMMLGACAQAETTLPSNACFSPGMIAVTKATADAPAITMEAEFTVEDALYARDLSVLNQMLSGTTIRYDGGSEAGKAVDMLTILRDEQTLLSAQAVQDGDGVLMTLNNGRTYAMPQGEAMQDDVLPGWISEIMLAGGSILERVPLTAMEQGLLALQTGDVLIGGLKVVTPFTVQRTISDDGERLTKLDITGSVGWDGEAPWTISGFLRQPGGRQPKDTFELTLTKDEDNTFALAYSALRKSEVTAKNRQGEVSVSTVLKASGKLDGSRITTSLKVNAKNSWTANGDQLDERITITTSIAHQDRTPGRRMQRLNDVDVSSRSVMRVTSLDGQAKGYTDESTLSITMDGNVFLAGGMNLRVSTRDALPDAETDATDAMPAGEIRDAINTAVGTLSERIYPLLPQGAKDKILDGLK